jgi:hypothetical protein
MGAAYESLILDIRYSERSWIYLKVLFESEILLTRILNMAVVRKCEFIFRQTLNHSVYNYLGNFVQC